MASDGDGIAGFSRREFLRLASMATETIMVGSMAAGCAEPWEQQPAIEVESQHPGICRFCGTGCETMIGVTDGTIVDVKGDGRERNRGRLCIKGILNREILYAETASWCASCHVMDPFVDDTQNAESNTLAVRHYKNK